MKYTAVVVLGLSMFIAVSSSLAQNKVVVVPLSSAKNLHNVVTVSPKGGDFTDPVAAVESISGASAANPYLVLIGPGVYPVTRTLAMKPFVTIAGSGREATLLTGAISSGAADNTSAIIMGSDNAVLRDLSVENTGGGSNSFAIYNYHAAPVIRNVTARAYGGTSNRGVNNLFSEPVMSAMTASASGGSSSYGVYNHICSPVMSDMTAAASGGSASTGVYNYASSPAMTRVHAMATEGADTNHGVFNSSAAAPVMTGVFAEASGGTENAGVYIDNASPVMRNCIVQGDTYGIILINGGTAHIMRSSVIGGVSVPGILSCVLSDNGEDNTLLPDCTLPP